MNFTLFGYPKSGKTTLFNLLTGANIDTSAFNSGKKEPNLRTCSVPDSRLDKIHTLYPDKKKIMAAIDYIDLAGMSYGEIKNEAYLSHLRKADGLTHVVRGFEDERIPSLKGKIDPREDILSMEDELILADLVSAESRIEKLEKELKREKNPQGEKEKDLLERIRVHLEKGEGLRVVELTETEDKLVRSFAFLSQKPLLHMINVDEKDIPAVETPEKFYPTPNKGTGVLVFCGKIEAEILELDDKEKEVFLEEYGLHQLSSPKFLKSSYDLLDVITFFTIGKQEVRAWAIKNTSTASSAAGTIHTDMEKGFIRAEVISWTQLVDFTSMQAAKENGAVRLEGKDYIVQDGDVIYFRFSK
ncbi:MAG: redox-regulated ATPase YchF [Candidatus Aminicenantes bacterium]|nr:MAG: redox-regulated ATPase YchF [Candidatus Aminicenantes bacterium]